MPCSVCSSVPHVSRANSDRDEFFPRAVVSLTRHDLGREDDLWECPECEAVFHWHSESSWTGSGNDDGEVLTRLPSSQAAVVRAFTRGEAPQARGLSGLPDVVRSLVLSYALRNDRDRAERLVPWVLDQVHRSGAPWARQFLARMGRPVEAARCAAPPAPEPVAPSPEPRPAAGREGPWTRAEAHFPLGLPFENARAFGLDVAEKLGLRREDVAIRLERRWEEDAASGEHECFTSMSVDLGRVNLFAAAGNVPFREYSLDGPPEDVARAREAIVAILGTIGRRRLRTRNDLALPESWEERAWRRPPDEVGLDGTSWRLQREGAAWFAVEVSPSGISRTAVGPIPGILQWTTIQRRRAGGEVRTGPSLEVLAMALLGATLGAPEHDSVIEHLGEPVGRRRRYRAGPWVLLEGEARWSSFLPTMTSVRIHNEHGDPWCVFVDLVVDGTPADQATARILGGASHRDEIAQRLSMVLDDAGWSVLAADG